MNGNTLDRGRIPDWRPSAEGTEGETNTPSATYLPTPAEIKLACMAIQSKWSEKERRKRSMQTSTMRRTFSMIEANIVSLPKGLEYILDN